MRGLTFFLFLLSFQAFPQEVFFKDQEYLYDDPPAHLYLHGQGETFDITSDYITKDSKYALRYTHPNDVAKIVGRNYHKNSAVRVDDYDANIIIPSGVLSEAINNNHAFTISGWFYINDINTARAVFYLGNDSQRKVDVLIYDRKIIVRKRSPFGGETMLPVIETAFPLEYDEYVPTAGDITNGYFYLALSTDANSTRVYLSRPGGRLYSQWFYFSLLDAVSGNDEIRFGRSPGMPNSFDSMDAYSNIMVYNKVLSPNDALNAFYLQSPLYPGISYRFVNDQQELVPAQSDNRNGEFDDDSYFRWRNVQSDVNGALSSVRWFIDSKEKGAAKYVPVSLRNARTGGYVYQKTGTNYYEHLLFPAEQYVGRTTFYMEKLEDDPKTLYSRYGKGSIKFWSAHEPDYWLGKNDGYLYLDDNENNGRWSISSADKVYRGSDRELPIRGHKVKLRNIGDYASQDKGARTYMNIYSGASYYYAKLDKYSVAAPDISKVVEYSLRWLAPSNYGVYNRYTLRALNNYGTVQSYYGKDDKTNNDYVIAYNEGTDYYWELLAIETQKVDKTKEGDRQVYAIRANNGYGAFLLGRKDGYCPGGTKICYVLKSGAGAFDSDGTPKKDFLWIIDYISEN